MIRFHRPAVLGAATLLAAAGLSSVAAPEAPDATTGKGALATPAPAENRRGIVLMTVDSLRTDHLGCYAGASRRTPSIDALARAGVRYERAYAASVSTAPSVASLMTGLDPAGHGLRDDLGGRLAAGPATLAERLRAAGWATAAVVGTDRLDSDRGLDRGFDSYDDDIQGIRKLVVGLSKERRASEVLERGLAAIEALPADRPFFLWLHFHDPHFDHDPPEPQKTEYAGSPYDGEVAVVDDAVGATVRNLRGLFPGGRLTFVLAGTHGEGLGESGEVGHGFSLSDAVSRVPLIVVPERGGPAGIGVPEPVGLVDLAPTLAALAGAPPVAGLDGIALPSLAPPGPAGGEGDRPRRRRGEPAATRRIVTEAAAPRTAFGWSPLVAVVQGDRRVVLAPGGRVDAYEGAGGPADAAPITGRPRWVKALAAEGEARLGSLEIPEDRKAAIREAVAAVTFPWDNSPFCVEKGNFPDPRDADRVAIAASLFEARVEAGQGIIGRSGKKGIAALEADPANLTALEMVLILGLKNRWGDMLLDTLEVLTCNYPYRTDGYHYLGHFYSQKREMEKALEAFRLMALVDPANQEAQYDQACTLGALGRMDEAFDHLRRAVALGADDFEFMRRDPRLVPLRGDPRFAEAFP